MLKFKLFKVLHNFIISYTIFIIPVNLIIWLNRFNSPFSVGTLGTAADLSFISCI